MITSSLPGTLSVSVDAAVGFLAASPATAHDLPAERLVELTFLTWANARSGGDIGRLSAV